MFCYDPLYFFVASLRGSVTSDKLRTSSSGLPTSILGFRKQ